MRHEVDTSPDQLFTLVTPERTRWVEQLAERRRREAAIWAEHEALIRQHRRAQRRTAIWAFLLGVSGAAALVLAALLYAQH